MSFLSMQECHVTSLPSIIVVGDMHNPHGDCLLHSCTLSWNMVGMSWSSTSPLSMQECHVSSSINVVGDVIHGVSYNALLSHNCQLNVNFLAKRILDYTVRKAFLWTLSRYVDLFLKSDLLDEWLRKQSCIILVIDVSGSLCFSFPTTIYRCEGLLPKLSSIPRTVSIIQGLKQFCIFSIIVI